MSAHRPAVLTGITVLQIVLGSLSILGGACVPLVFVPESAPTDASLPLLVAAITHGFLGAMMLLGGIGLVNLGSWGKSVTEVWGGVSILVHLGGIVYVFVFASNSVNMALAAFERGGLSAGTRIAPLVGVTLSALAIVYAIVVLVVLGSAEVSAAIQAGPASRNGPRRYRSRR